MKKICIINGSPRGIDSNSFFLLKKFAAKLKGYNNYWINVVESDSESIDNFQHIISSDVVIFAFPLYVYCVPGLLMQFLQCYYEYYRNAKFPNKKVKVYLIINCAFEDPIVCSEVIRVISCFCNKVNYTLRMTVSIGNSGVLNLVKKNSKLEHILSEVYVIMDYFVKDIDTNSEKASISKYSVSLLNGTTLNKGKAGWIKIAQKNGLSEKDLYNKPMIERVKVGGI